MIAQLTNHLRTPLYRNGYSLVLSSIAGSGLGMLYWILAARLYETHILGLNSASLSTILFMAYASQINMANTLNRFLPSARQRSKRMVLTAYAVNSGLGFIVSSIFVAGLSLWSPSLSPFVSTRAVMGMFVLFTVASGIFALQDSALTGIRQAVWLPVENILFALAKIVLLVVFASRMPTYGILVSWLLPLLMTVVLVNILLFRFLLPRHAAQPVASTEVVNTRHVISFMAGDYIGAVFWTGAAFLQPLVVTQLAGSAATAYFYLSWQVAYALYLVSQNIGMSLIAEAAADPMKLNAYSFRVLKQSMLLIVPIVLVIQVGAPQILHLFGREYATEGATLLRLLTLSAIPQVIVSLHLSIARVQRRVKTLMFTQAALSVMVLSLIPIFLGWFGLTGIGWAWVIAQSILATVLLFTRLRDIVLSNLNLDVPLRMVHRLRRLLSASQDQRLVNTINQGFPTLAKEAVQVGDLPEDWRVFQVLQTVNDLTVLTMGSPGEAPKALLKLARSEQAEAGLRNQQSALRHLNSLENLAELNRLAPRIFAEGYLDNQYFLVEEMLPGIDSRLILRRDGCAMQVLTAASEAIGRLHQETLATMPVNTELLQEWVDVRLRLIDEAGSQPSQYQTAHQGTNKLSSELYNGLQGKTLPVSSIHGDFSPGNILVNPEDGSVTGIVDWDQSDKDHPIIDQIHLLLTARILIQRRELGDIIRSMLEGNDCWSPEELALLEAAQMRLPGDQVDMRTLLLLTWLRHVTSNLSKSSRYSGHWLWMTKNVHGVLSCL